MRHQPDARTTAAVAYFAAHPEAAIRFLADIAGSGRPEAKRARQILIDLGLPPDHNPDCADCRRAVRALRRRSTP
jgi:hypothetical protein